MRFGHFARSLITLLVLSVSAEANTVIYRFDRIIDGTGELLPARDIAVNGTRIEAVGSALDQSINGKLIVLDGLTALPGLIDAHTHITYSLIDEPKGDAWAEMIASDRSDRYEAAKRSALKTLQTGVTSIRDLNADQDLDYDLRDAINRGELVGPRIFTSGQGIHPAYDPLPEGMETATAAFLRAAAEKRLSAGADWIKIFGTSGSADDLTSRAYYSAEAITAAADAAQTAGKRITVHTYGPEGVDAAIAARVTSVEHPVGMTDTQVAAMKQHGIIYVPTIDHNRYYAQHGAEFGYGPDIQANLHVFVGRTIETVRRAHEVGVTIAMGSDAVMTGFGDNTCELKAFVSAGLTPAEAIRTATLNGALLLGREADLGRLQPGFAADFVAVTGNPLEDINQLVSGVMMVMKNGTLVVDHRLDPSAVNNPDCGVLYTQGAAAGH